MKDFASIDIHLTNKCEESFQKLKILLTTTPILTYPWKVRTALFIVMFHDSLDVVLIQNKNIIAYALHQLKVHERNYPTHVWDIISMVPNTRYNLQHVFFQRDLNLRQRRWMKLLKYHDIIIQHHSSKANMVAVWQTH